MPLYSTVPETFEPRHHPEHRPSSRSCPWHSRALLCPWEDVLTQYPLLRRGQERGPEGLPEHDSGFLRLPIMSHSFPFHTPDSAWSPDLPVYPIPILHWMRDYIPVATWRWFCSLSKDKCVLQNVFSFKSEWTARKESANFGKIAHPIEHGVILWHGCYERLKKLPFFCALWMCRCLCVEDVGMNYNMNLYSVFPFFRY